MSMYLQLFLCVGFLGFIHLYKYNILLYITAGYLFLSGLTCAFYPEIFNFIFTLNVNQALMNMSNASFRALVFGAAIFITIMGMGKKKFKKFTNIFGTVVITDCLILFFNDGTQGLIGNRSMEATFLVISYPLVCCLFTTGYMKWWVRFIMLLAIVLCNCSSGYGGLALLAFIWLWKNNRKLLLLSPLILIAGYFLDSHLLDDSLRFQMWKYVMVWWWKNTNHFIGTGLGTYQSLCLFIQLTTHHMKDNVIYTFMHNEWLQVLFETGYIGLLLVGGFWIWLLRKSYNSKIFSSVVAYGALSLIQMPTRYCLTAILGMILIRLTTERDDESVFR